jgi:hypothetical protein
MIDESFNIVHGAGRGCAFGTWSMAPGIVQDRADHAASMVDKGAAALKK